MTTRNVMLVVLVLLLSVPFIALAQTNTESPKPKSIDNVAIVEIANDQSSLTGYQDGETFTFSVPETELRSSLKTFGPGDQIKLKYLDQDKEGKKILKSIAIRECRPTSEAIMLTIFLPPFLLLLALLSFLPGRIPRLFVGTDNRYSSSKFQMVVWFFALIYGYVGVTILRIWSGGASFAGGLGIPQNLLLISGLSVLTFAGAKAIVNNQVESGKLTKSIEGKPRLSDLVEDDQHNVDLGDFQMLLLTLIAVATYLVQVYGFVEVIGLHKKITLPDVDSTILASFGLGQGAYLMKKYVGPGKDEKPTEKSQDKKDDKDKVDIKAEPKVL